MAPLKYFSKNLLFIASFSFFLTGSLSLTFMKPETKTLVKEEKHIFDASPIPLIKKQASDFPVLSAQGVYALDLDSAMVLYEKNPDLPLYPASTTKIVTALVAMKAYDLNEVLNTGTFNVVGQKMGLTWNESIKFEDLLYGLLIHSGNDAAEVLAQNYEGGREAFVSEMNLMARKLFATNTTFKNPSGLDEFGQVTTARDLVNISKTAMKDPKFSKVVSTKEILASSADGKIAHDLSNRNELLGKVEGVLGVKTGWTEEARENLVTYVDRDGKRIILAILGSQDRFGESQELIEWIYANYEWSDVNSLDLGQR